MVDKNLIHLNISKNIKENKIKKKKTFRTNYKQHLSFVYHSVIFIIFHQNLFDLDLNKNNNKNYILLRNLNIHKFCLPLNILCKTLL